MAVSAIINRKSYAELAMGFDLPNLGGHWPFDGTYTDAGPGGNTAEVVSGTPTFTDGLIDSSSGAVLTDPSNYLKIPHNNSLNLATGSIAISFWAKCTASAGGYWLAKKVGTTSAAYPGWYLYNVSATLSTFLIANGTYRSYAATSSELNSDALQHHWLIGIDRVAGRHVWYRDAVRVVYATGSDHSVAEVTGDCSNTSDTYIKGCATMNMDELTIYQAAPTQALADALYLNGVN